MSASQRNRLAVLTATLILLVAGLVTLAAAGGFNSTETRSSSVVHHHVGFTTPSPARTLNAVTGHGSLALDGDLTALLLLAAALGFLVNSRYRRRGWTAEASRLVWVRGPPAC